MVAFAEIRVGAALLASAISVSRVISYSLNGA
jgi:hypothetical protein